MTFVSSNNLLRREENSPQREKCDSCNLRCSTLTIHLVCLMMFRVTIAALAILLALISNAKAQSSNSSSIPQIEDRIVNGSALKVVNRKFQVAVILGPYLCGGSLLSMEWVVSAGHCVNGQTASNTYVRAGSNNWDYGGVVRYAKTLFLHPGFNPSNLFNDISLILLQSPFVPNNYIGTISIASNLPAAGQQLYVSGFGQTSTNGNLAPYLEGVWVDMVSFTQCQQYYNNQLLSTMFCAGDQGGKGSCHGDSGGPITFNGNLVGVVSWGYDCGDNNYPTVYTRAPLFSSWIQTTMSSN
ncbi:trypsin alpha-3-like [Condylostylus longicornis]|uniref:trypsin alpha-3-like n=1 Tax=Condylostylus longicornis TaxID=2530218 RepID=UPI00244E0EBF|nr:trypsin alpha-3-like [Condylostylus longicornis]